MHESAIGTKRTSLVALHMSAFGGKADMSYCSANVRFGLPAQPVDATLALNGGLNRSMQHLLILPDEEVCIWRECTDMVHAEAEG